MQPIFLASYIDMKQINEFTISLSGNKEGTSEYNFKLDLSFFEHFEDQEVLDADVDVNMTLIKGINLFEMNFELMGNLTVACDRCLEPMVQDIDHEAKLIIKLGEEYQEIDDTVIIIPANDDEINIASYVFEYAKLALPIQRIHEDGECNDEMLDQMRKYERREELEEKTDSRWDILAQLKDKLD